MRIIAAAGYDPEALTRYLARLQPSDTERIDAIEKAIQTLPPQNSTILDSSEFQYIQEKIARKPGPKPSLFR